jgi:hypothetical protein
LREAVIELNRLQCELELIYEIEVAHRVDDFLITDRETLNGYQQSTTTRPEQLLVSEDGEWVGLALFIDPEVLRRLDAQDPLRRIHADNFQHFCIALEGVSHFVYLAWNAAYDRSVSLLELEMQAEVDKYVSLARLLARQQGGRVQGTLMRCLFDNVCFDESLGHEESRRYWKANRYARSYCVGLEQRYPGRADDRLDMLRELRRFYRLGGRDKIRCIDGTQRGL